MSTTPVSESRAQVIDHVAQNLLISTARLSRAVIGPRAVLARSEASLLSSLADGPLCITQLARAEAVRQPTITGLVASLERRSLVERRRSDDDGRVVLVEITPAGCEALQAAREWNRDRLQELLHALGDEQLADLASACDILEELAAEIREQPAKP